MAERTLLYKATEVNVRAKPMASGIDGSGSLPEFSWVSLSKTVGFILGLLWNRSLLLGGLRLLMAAGILGTISDR